MEEDYTKKADAIAAILTKKIETIALNQKREFIPSSVSKDRKPKPDRQTGR